MFGKQEVMNNQQNQFPSNQQHVPYGPNGQQVYPNGSYGMPNNSINPNRPNFNGMPGGPGNVPNRQGYGSQNSPKGQQKKKSQKKKIIPLAVFGVIGLILGTILYIAVNNYAKKLTVINLPGLSVNGSETGKENSDGSSEEGSLVAQSTVDMAAVTAPKGETWDGSTRITCLAMGLDYRDWEAGEMYSRSDSMMLLTYDPVTQYAGMLSLPRDLWVAIPDHGYGRINTAYYLGEAEHLPGGGPGLAMQTVELFLGIDIQYYAVINFEGFIDFIDSIDKLAINVRDDITVDPIGPGNTVRLMAGVQDLDGATALAYARYRYSGGGDFERAQRQQDVIFALYEQMKWQLPELLTTKRDALFNSIQKAVTTNISLSDMLKLAWTVTEIQDYRILRSVIAPPDQVEYGETSDGTQQILIPIPDKIREARDAIFSTNISAAPYSGASDRTQQVGQEAARVTVINGSTVPGILEQTTAYLQQFGVQIVSTGTGAAVSGNTMEIKRGKPYTALYFAELMQIPTASITMNYDEYSYVDIVLTISDAWANNNIMGQ